MAEFIGKQTVPVLIEFAGIGDLIENLKSCVETANKLLDEFEKVKTAAAKIEISIGGKH